METKKRISAAGFDLNDPQIQNSKKEVIRMIKIYYYDYKKWQGLFKHSFYVMGVIALILAYTIFRFGFNHWGFIVLHSVLFSGLLTVFYVAGNFRDKKSLSATMFGLLTMGFTTGFSEIESNSEDELVNIIQKFENERHLHQTIL